MKLVVQREFTPLMPTYSFNFSFPSSIANLIYLRNAQLFWSHFDQCFKCCTPYYQWLYLCLEIPIHLKRGFFILWKYVKLLAIFYILKSHSHFSNQFGLTKPVLWEYPVTKAFRMMLTWNFNSEVLSYVLSKIVYTLRNLNNIKHELVETLLFTN